MKKKSTPCISVIIPFYNEENNILNCIISITQQTLTNLEIIFVDDCSTDNTLKIIKPFQVTDARIKIFSNHSNIGLGASRNFGINKAQGEYIFFIDADDYLEITTLDKLYKNAKKIDADYIGYNHVKVWKNNKMLYHHKKTFIEKYFQSMSCVTKLYKKAFLYKYNILFDEFRLAEDMAFAFKVYLFAQKASWLEHDGYYYVQRQNSLCYPKKKSYDRKILEGVITALKNIDTLLQENHLNKNYEVLQKKLNEVKVNYLYTHYLRRHIDNQPLFLKKALRYLNSSPLKNALLEKIDPPKLKEPSTTLFNLLNKHKTKKFILYGFNELAIKMFSDFHNQIINIVDQKRCGEIFQNHVIKNFNEIVKINNTHIFVITAMNNTFIEEITNKITDAFPDAKIIHLPYNTRKHFSKHELTNQINLTQYSQSRLDFFLKSEEIQMSMFLSFIKYFNPYMVFDIGANVGLYSLISHKYFPNINYHCFEPTPNIFEHLIKNISMIKDNHTIKPSSIALSSKKGKQVFYDFGVSSGRNGIKQTSIHFTVKDLATEIIVKSNTLDNLYKIKNQILLFKIDTEGHEFNVIKGAKKLLSNNNCIIQLELEFQDTKKVKELFKTINYTKIFTIGPDSFYTNIKDLTKSKLQKEFLENAISSLIYTKWGKKYQC